MSLINTTALGVSALFYPQNPPKPSLYNSIKVYGGIIVDHIHIKNNELTTTEMQSLPLYNPPVWDGNTIFLANFQNNLNAGTTTTLSNPLTHWVIQRRKTTETKFTILATVDANTMTYKDITAQPNVSYIYQVLGINSTEITEPLVNTLDSSFYNCLLIDPITGLAFIFDANLEFDGYQNETAHQRYDGYDTYSAHSFGNRNFKTGDVKAIVSDSFTLDNGLIQTVDYLKLFQSFINNGSEKIFKDRKGNVLKVVTTGGVEQEPLNINIGQQPYYLKFHFEEVGEVDG